MTLTLLTPEADDTLCVVTPVQRDFIQNRDFGRLRADNLELVDWLGLKQDESKDNSIPLPYRFSWASDEKPSLNFVLQVAKDDAFASPVREIRTKRKQAVVWNLELGARYHWRVIVEDGSAVSETRAFQTEMALPRWIYVGGLTNVRDCGGWPTSTGLRIRQGLLYRGSEMDRHHAITPAGHLTLRDELRLRTDLDIRGAELPQGYKPHLARDDIAWINIGISPYGEIAKDECKAAYRKLFTALANPDLYPAHLHCFGGADRTGTVCLLLGGVLGMSDADLVTDYELTSLAIYSARRRNFKLFNELLGVLDGYGGRDAPLSVKSVNYLLSAGVTPEQIDEIRDIFLGKT